MKPIRLLVITLALAHSALAQTGALAPVPRLEPRSNTGTPAAGACLYSYAAGTSTPQLTYSDSALGTPNTNPVVTDAYGRAPSMYLSANAYKFVLGQKVLGSCPATPANVVWTQDNIYDVGQLLKRDMATTGTGKGTELVMYKAVGVGAVERKLTDKLAERPSVLDFGADPTGAADSTTAFQAALNAMATTKRMTCPAGTYKITTKLTLVNVSGVTFEGAGSGISGGGCVLKWSGAADGTMVEIQEGVTGSTFKGFVLDGNSLASKGLHFKGWTTANIQAARNTFDSIAIWNVTGTGAIGLHVGNTTNPDVSQNDFGNITIDYDSGTMTALLQQDGGQTVSNHYHDFTFTYTGSGTAPAYMAHFVAGDIRIDHSNFLGVTGTAQFAYEAATLFGSFSNNYSENTAPVATAGPAVLAPAGNHPWSMSFDSNRWAWDPTDAANKLIDIRQNGTVTFTNNTLDSTSGTGAGQVYFTGAVDGIRVQWHQNKLNGVANFPVAFGSNYVFRGDSTSGLCFGAATPCPSDVVYSDQSREASLMLYDKDPRFTMRNKDAAADEGTWDFVPLATDFRLRALNDARNSGTTVLTVNRGTGAAVDDVTFGVPLIAPSLATADPTTLSSINAAQASGLSFKRATASTGGIGADAYFDVDVTWSVAWLDTGYYPVCSVYDDSGSGGNSLEVIRLSGLTAAKITVTVHNRDSGASHSGVVLCIGAR